jgi:hypothetical protein
VSKVRTEERVRQGQRRSQGVVRGRQARLMRVRLMRERLTRMRKPHPERRLAGRKGGLGKEETRDREGGRGSSGELAE